MTFQDLVQQLMQVRQADFPYVDPQTPSTLPQPPAPDPAWNPLRPLYWDFNPGGRWEWDRQWQQQWQQVPPLPYTSPLGPPPVQMPYEPYDEARGLRVPL